MRFRKNFQRMRWPSAIRWNISRPFLSYGAILVVALSLRLFGLSAQNIWYDEHWTLRVADVPLEKLPAILIAEESSKPPLYFAFMHYWLKASPSELWLRLPSAISGALDCVAAAAIGRLLLSFRAAQLLGWLLVFSPFQIFYSQEGRPYAFWSLLMSLALLFHVRFCQKPERRFLSCYIFFATLACYTFTYSVFVVGFSILFAWLYRPALSASQRRQVILSNAVILLLFSPWLWKVIAALANGVGLLPTFDRPLYAAAAYALFSFAFGVSAGPSLEKLHLLRLGIFREAPGSGAILIFGSILLAVLLAYGWMRLWRSNRNAFYFSTLGLLFFWGGAVLLNLTDSDIPLNARYAFPTIVPLLVAIVSACLGALKSKTSLALVVMYFLMIGGSLGNLYFNPRYARDDLRAAARFVRELRPPSEEVIVCAAHLVDVFAHYFGQDTPLEALTLPAERSVGELLQHTYERLDGIHRFSLVYSRQDHGDPAQVLPSLMQARYRLIQREHWTGVDVYVFETFNGTTNSIVRRNNAAP